MGWLAEYQRELIISGSTLVALLVLRWLLVSRYLRQDKLPGETRRRLVVNARNITLLLFVVAMFLIWAQELQAMAFSVFAIAAALVIATKELILCLSGTLIRAHVFAVGDRIDVTGHRGDVIDKTTLTTRLLEIGPGNEGHQYTGRVLVIPNSRLLSDTVVNETGLGDYQTHIIVVPMKLEDDWRKAREALLAAGRAAVGTYQSRAATYFRALEAARGHYAPNAEPRVSVSLPEPGRVNLQLRVPIPKGRKHRIQQLVLNQFLEHLEATKKPKEPAANGAAPPAEIPAASVTGPPGS